MSATPTMGTVPRSVPTLQGATPAAATWVISWPQTTGHAAVREVHVLL